MKRKHTSISITRWTCGSLLALLLATGSVVAAPTGDVVEIENRLTKLVFYPVVDEPFNRIIVTVTGPCNYEYREVIKPGDVGVWRLSAETIDAIYRVQAVAMPEVDRNILEILQQARKEDEYSQVNALCREGALPGAPLTQALGFRVFEGKIQWDPDEQEDQFASTPDSSTTGGDSFIPLKDFVINDDLIVDGSACIGFDCVNGESFGFDTIRLKEHNLRIKFEDTSTAASFPGNDWQLTANASANGGASKFSIDDISGSRTPFTVEANARSHSLYVDDGGRIGNRTSTPSTEIHTIDGDTPTLRLQQDGSSGFAPQTWDVAGNETNFFIRDVSNGSTLPFRIRPGAPTSSIFIDVDGDVGIGNSSPDAALDVERTGTSVATIAQFQNGGAVRVALVNNNTGTTWFNRIGGTGTYAISESSTGVDELALDSSGNLTIQGALTTATMTYPDYVFEPGYPLMSLDEVAAFIDENGHLPNIPSAAEVDGGRRVNLSQLGVKLLEKVEELTLYTLSQEEIIRQLQERLAALENASE